MEYSNGWTDGRRSGARVVLGHVHTEIDKLQEELERSVNIINTTMPPLITDEIESAHPTDAHAHGVFRGGSAAYEQVVHNLVDIRKRLSDLASDLDNK